MRSAHGREEDLPAGRPGVVHARINHQHKQIITEYLGKQALETDVKIVGFHLNTIY